jgi:hypothetical protein
MRSMQYAATMRGWNYSHCFLIYCIVFLALIAQVCGSAGVISPLRQGPYLGSQTEEASLRPENGKFSDYVTFYAPEATGFLSGKRSSWITTWAPYNELGRPASHMLDLSPAYLPNWIFSKFLTDPFSYLTAISLLAIFLTGAFAFLLARELELVPAAALIAALAIGLSPSLIYWATFPMFASAYGWTCAVLYGITRLIRRQDFLAWLTIAFAIYSLLMTAYPVMVVYHAYLVAGFIIYLALKHPSFPRDIREFARLSLGLGSAAALGILATIPALIDTFQTTQNSARTHPDVSFFQAVIPALRSWTDWERFLTFWTFPQVLGNPILGTFPSQFNGRSLAPVVVFLLCASNLRRTWGWWLAVLILLSADATPLVFAFAVAHLGFNISRSVPTAQILIPLTMIVAVSVDSILRREDHDAPTRKWHALRKHAPLIGAALLYMLLLTIAIRTAAQYRIAIEYLTVIIFTGYLPLLALALRYRLPGLIVIAMVAHLMLFDRAEFLVQPRSAIAQSTPLTDRLQKLLADGGRYALLDSSSALLPPNINAQIKLSSIHTYDSLSPLRYQALVRRLGGEVMTYGRSNESISASALGTVDFHLANIGALITREPLASADVALDSNIGGFLIYRVLERWGAYTRFDLNSIDLESDSARVIDTSSMEKHAATAVIDSGDRVILRLAHKSDATTVLVVSQSFHFNWHAYAGSSGSWRALRTLPVDDAYEGIIVPPGVDSLRLSFIPWVRWSWLSHAAFSVLAALLAFSWYRRCRAERH